MRLDDRNELERQLAAAEQRQSAPVGAVQNPVDSFIRTLYMEHRALATGRALYGTDSSLSQ